MSQDSCLMKPIPLYPENVFYKHIGVDQSDARNTELLVDVRNYGLAGVNYYHSKNNPPYNHSIPESIPHLLLRQSLAERLGAANTYLRTLGLEIFIFDAYRPIAVQNYFHDVWMPKFLLGLNPERGMEWAREETQKYWSPGAANIEEAKAYPPPHSTGGAVDLTLRFIGGERLEMGTMFDDLCEESRVDYYERREVRTFTHMEARKNRRILYNAMAAQGFVPHPKEWWHYSYGDRVWASLKKTLSFYGYADQANASRSSATQDPA